MTTPAQTLVQAQIAELIPHSGTMCLLQALDAWDKQHIACRADNHRDPHNPLRTRSGLLAPNAIEYAAQAMALHGALIGIESGKLVDPHQCQPSTDVLLRADRRDPGDAIAECLRRRSQQPWQRGIIDPFNADGVNTGWNMEVTVATYGSFKMGWPLEGGATDFFNPLGN